MEEEKKKTGRGGRREGAGRKPRNGKEARVNFGVMVEPATIKRIEAYCEKHGVKKGVAIDMIFKNID